MGLIKYILNMVFYPLLYIITLMLALYKEFGDNTNTNALDGIKDAKQYASTLHDAIDTPVATPATTNADTSRAL